LSSKIEDDVREHLQRKDQWMVLTTLGKDGFPHSVPLGYFLVGDSIILPCKDGTQKVRNAEREPKVSLLWENGRGADHLIGIMFRGYARVVRDHEGRLALKQEACRQRGEEIPSSVGDGFVYIEVKPEKTVYWNRPSRATPRHKS
jgi:general stress protein 26